MVPLMNPIRLNAFGVGLACLYVILAPIMLQNSSDPSLPGRFGRMQIADLLAPLMLLWLVLHVRYESFNRSFLSDNSNRLLLACAVIYIIVGPASGMLAEDKIPLADTIKRVYLVMTFLFFLQVNRIEHASFIILCVTIYILLIFAGLSLVFYAIYLITGESNIFVHIGSSIVFDRAAGQLIGPMRPTEKLFATYLILLAGALFIGANHLSRRVWYVLLATVLLCALLTGSRQGVLTAIFIVLSLVVSSRQRALWLAFLTFPTLITLVFLELSAIWDIYKIIGAVESGNSIKEIWVPTTAKYLKEVAWQLWTTHPIMGSGPENFIEGWFQSGRSGLLPPDLTNLRAETPNSTYLYLLAETGLIGLLSWLGLIVIPLIRLKKKCREIPGGKWTLLLWLGCLGIVMIDLTITNFRFFYYMIPLIAAIPTKNLGIPRQWDL